MRRPRVRRLLILTTAVAVITTLMSAIAFATCEEGEGGATNELEVSPDPWDGLYTQEQIFTVKNTGQDAITALVISLISPAEGLKITSNTCGSTLAAGATCDVKVKCFKQDKGVLSAIQYSPIAIDTSILYCTVG